MEPRLASELYYVAVVATGLFIAVKFFPDGTDRLLGDLCCGGWLCSVAPN